MALLTAAKPPSPDLSMVVGHGQQLGRLRHQLSEAAVAHAYWISGPPQVGKTTLALALAGELLDAVGWPGGLVAHPDLWLEDGEGTIKIDRICDRDFHETEGPTLQHFLSLSSFAGRAKVAVIANADRMSLEASNSLLRLLEEPPSHSVICLTTSRPDSERLPSTLRSRCQDIRLGPVDAVLIAPWVASVTGCGSGAAELAAALCQGRPGLARELVADPDLEERSRSAVAALLACSGVGPGRWLDLSRELAERGRDRNQAMFAARSWVAFLRDCCCLAAGAPELATLPLWGGAATSWATTLGLRGCLRRYDLALDVLSRLAEMATARLVLDRFLLLTFGGVAPNPPAMGSE